MFRFFYIILLFILLSPTNIKAQLSNEGEVKNRAQFGLGMNIETHKLKEAFSDSSTTPVYYNFSFILFFQTTSHHIVKIGLFGFDGLSNDVYNNGKANYSILSLFSMIWWVKGMRGAPDGKRLNWGKNPSLLFASLLNSTHYFLAEVPKFTHDVSLRGLANVGLYVKSNTQFYMFRKEKWVRFSPGIGIAFLNESFVLEVGISRAIDFAPGGPKATSFLQISFSFTGEMH